MDTELLRHKDVWVFTHAGLVCEIIHHSKGKMVNSGRGIWCYYIYVPESKCPSGRFESLWITDERVKCHPTCPERITHPGSEYLFSNCEWHGGVTFYTKHGHTEGHRCIQIGCDFSHLWDEERGFDYNVDEVAFEARRTAELITLDLKGISEC